MIFDGKRGIAIRAGMVSNKFGHHNIHGKREHVQELFDWDDDVITMLKKRRPSGCKTLSDKKHRSVCYLFESTMQMRLSPSDNLSQNPGCEAFSHVWDEGYEEINMDEYM